MSIMQTIKQQVTENPVIIYMKGSPELPQCGFSANAVKALKSTGVPFAYVNVLESPRIFQALPEYADWPTFPQIFIGGELIGGGDIVVEMAASGTLKGVMESAVSGNGGQA